MAEIGLFQLVVSRQVLDEAERNLRKKLPQALPNFAAQLAQVSLEIVPDPSENICREWVAVIEAKDTPILAAAVLAETRPLRHPEYEALHRSSGASFGFDHPHPSGVHPGNSLLGRSRAWRSFKIEYHPHYICELLDQLGFLFQKARFLRII